DSRASAYTYGYHAPVTRTPAPAAAAPARGAAVSAQPAADAGLGILRWSKRRNGDSNDVYDAEPELADEPYDAETSATPEYDALSDQAQADDVYDSSPDTADSAVSEDIAVSEDSAVSEDRAD